MDKGMKIQKFRLGWAFIFLISPAALFAAPGMDDNGFITIQSETGLPSSRNINEDDPNRQAPSSEITIDLEKKVVPREDDTVLPVDPVNGQDFNPENPIFTIWVHTGYAVLIISMIVWMVYIEFIM